MRGILVPVIWSALGIGIAWFGVSGWRDRPMGHTLWWLAGAWFLLLVPAAWITDSEVVVLGMLLVLIIAFPGVAGLVEWRWARERVQQRDLAIAAGMEPQQARRQYRRGPRGAVTILAIYAVVAMLWCFTAIGMVLLSGHPDLATEPSMLISLSGEGEPLDAPWWMAVVIAVIATGTAHSIVNMLRTT